MTELWAMSPETLAAELERVKPDLHGYLRRMLVTSDAADDAFQNTAVRALQATDHAPAGIAELRPWLFRIATNIAIDEIRRLGRWKPDVLFESRPKAEGDPEFVKMSMGLRSTPEMQWIAKEHLVACFSCALRTLTPERAASLLLREVCGFTPDEIAAILGARWTQAKNWLQEARQQMQSYYEGRCALVRKDGICYQCAELAEFFNGERENPLANDGRLDARLRVLNELRHAKENPWHRRLFAVFDELE